ncbi:FecR family protein [Dyadobacter bucti]|uniref:FecR family protein n=1 Tax=Dyadobacter bucti TaxID=2572203 RepID=UPI003F730682
MITRQLLTRYRQGLCTPDELETVQFYLSGENLSELKRMLDEDWKDAAAETNQDGREAEERIWSKLAEDMDEVRELPVMVRRKFNLKFLWQCAAAAVIVVTAGWFISQQFASDELTYEINRSAAETALLEKINRTSGPMLITLSDGSRVRLSPKSKISYAASFDSELKREVYLSGEAFFIVTPNRDKPFFVYANELVTKVLGTSFNVRAYAEDKDVTVKVSTGRVSVEVAEKLRNHQNMTAREKGGILLTPNQQAVLSRQEFHLVKSLVENPLLIIPEGKTKTVKEVYSFKFQAATLNSVFEAIEKGYGVNIVFDDEILENCRLTADLSGESLYEKLDIICKSIEAEYQVFDAQIIITGKGCNF